MDPNVTVEREMTSAWYWNHHESSSEGPNMGFNLRWQSHATHSILHRVLCILNAILNVI